MNDRGAKISYDGLKKVDGVELHQVTYKAKKNSGATLLLYFDPATFRHVMTVCTTEIRAGIGFSETQSARQQVVRYRLEERFSNFQKVNGLTLPGTWNIHFTIDGYQSAVLEWKIRLRNAEDNVGIDPATYSLK